MQYNTPAEYHPRLLALSAVVPLHALAFYRPRVLSLPTGDVSCPTLFDLLSFVLAGNADDATLIEQAEFIIAAAMRVQQDPHRAYAKNIFGQLIFDAPAKAQHGAVLRAERTAAEKFELLADPACPADVRNQYEIELGLAVTPYTPVPQYKFPLPQILGEDGEPLPRAKAEIVAQDENGVTTLRYAGTERLLAFTIITGAGQPLPKFQSAALEPGAVLTIPLSATRLQSVRATGLIFRDGLVARDNPPTEQQAADDASAEAMLATEIRTCVKNMIATHATVEAMTAYVMSQSYKRTPAEAIVADVLNENGMTAADYTPA